MELAHIIESLIGQVQAPADAGDREAERVGGLEQITRSMKPPRACLNGRGRSHGANIALRIR